LNLGKGSSRFFEPKFHPPRIIFVFHAMTNGETIEEGGFYRRPDTGSVIETAEVLEVGRDTLGIPHVRFQLYVIRGTDARIEQRTLALDAFYVRYRERIYQDQSAA